MDIIKQSLYDKFAPKKRNHRITIFCIEMKNLLNQSPINRKMFTVGSFHSFYLEITLMRNL